VEAAMKRACLDLLRVVLACIPCAACVPMTLSNEAEIDFEAHRSVRVNVEAPLQDASTYLAGELRKSSGFQLVTTETSGAVDLLLTVTVQVDVDVTTDSNGDTDIDYRATGSFVATDPRGYVIVTGMEIDNSETPREAVEDVLDEVALHFLAPYRI
jgi:hypothetical protein